MDERDLEESERRWVEAYRRAQAIRRAESILVWSVPGMLVIAMVVLWLLYRPAF